MQDLPGQEVKSKKMVRKGLTGGSFKLLTEESIYKTHETVMRIIEEVGCQVNSETALELFKNAGAKVDKRQNRVRMSRVMALQLIRMGHQQIRLFGRDKKTD